MRPEPRQWLAHEDRAALTEAGRLAVDHLAAATAEQLPTMRQRLGELLSHYGERMAPVAERTCLALAYDLGLKTSDKLEPVARAAVAGGLHNAILDDVVDHGGRGRFFTLADLHPAQLLHSHYVVALTEIHPSSWPGSGQTRFLEAESETYDAMLTEERFHVGRSTPFCDETVVARKCAALKAIIDRILAATGQSHLYETAATGIDEAAMAWFLTDDLRDWHEDLAGGRVTFVLQKALEHLAIDLPAAQTPEGNTAVLKVLAVDLYPTLLSTALTRIDSALGRFSTISDGLCNELREHRRRIEASWQGHLVKLTEIARAQQSAGTSGR